jgi:hypothetical protein
MQSDIDPCDLSPCDLVFGGEITGLIIKRCSNWEQGPTHGGAMGNVRIFDGHDEIFTRTSLEDNQNGVTNYFKTFWQNIGDNTWPRLRAIVTINASSQFARESVAVALGDETDNMTNKPNDSGFSNQTAIIDEIEPGEAIPIWIRQRITAGGENAERGQNVQVQIMLMEAE